MGTLIVIIVGGVFFSLFLIFAVLDTLSAAIVLPVISGLKGDD